MSRLPSQIQPLFPYVKRGHRYGARALGAVGRRVPLATGRGLPWTATERSADTAAAEPDVVRRHVTGEAYVAERPLPPGEPAAHWNWTDNLRSPVPEQFTLELEGGTVLGRHSAIVSPGGRLDYETSHYFGISGWREHPVWWNPVPGPVEHVPGTVAVLSARGTGHNFFHFVVDALPRIGRLRAAFPGLEPDAWVVEHHAKWQRDLLELAGIPAGARLIEPGPRFALRADRLLVPSLPDAETVVSVETTTWLRDNLAPVDTESRPRRLYLTRGNVPNTRRVVDEDLIVGRLERFGFVPVAAEKLSIQDQVDHFAAAEAIVAPHGAALTGLNYCRPGVRVLEMFADSYPNPAFWSIATNVPDSRYRYMLGRTERPLTPGEAPLHFMDDVVVMPDRVERAVEQLLEED